MTRCTFVFADGEQCQDQEGHEEYVMNRGHLKPAALIKAMEKDGWWVCKTCEQTFLIEHELERHVSLNWPTCGTTKEATMAVTRAAAVVMETNQTWEQGKLKLTLTRKSASGMENTKPNRGATDTVMVINKDGKTQGSQGFMWSGPASEFKEFVGSLGALHQVVDQELNEHDEDASVFKKRR